MRVGAISFSSRHVVMSALNKMLMSSSTLAPFEVHSRPSTEVAVNARPINVLRGISPFRPA